MVLFLWEIGEESKNTQEASCLKNAAMILISIQWLQEADLLKLLVFGSRRSFIPDNLPTGSQEQYTKDRLKGWESKSNVFDSDADIVDHQVAIIEYENKAVLSFHTNMKVPDEFRRFAVIGSAGMIEGDFVRGFMKAHDENNNVLIDEDYGAAFRKRN